VHFAPPGKYQLVAALPQFGWKYMFPMLNFNRQVLCITTWRNHRLKFCKATKFRRQPWIWLRVLCRLWERKQPYLVSFMTNEAQRFVLGLALPSVGPRRTKTKKRDNMLGHVFSINITYIYITRNPQHARSFKVILAWLTFVKASQIARSNSYVSNIALLRSSWLRLR